MLPYRLDLAGGWLDQPFVSGLYPGSVITISLEPIKEYERRCGMATSTRDHISKIWDVLPEIDFRELIKIAFAYDNSPANRDVIAGAQDTIGICLPGLTRHFYRGSYIPMTIECCLDESITDWLEDHLFLKLLFPRPEGLDLFKGSNINYDNTIRLSEASDRCWESILNKDLEGFANALTMSFNAQKLLFPSMSNETIEAQFPECMGIKFAGAGGGGYLIMVNDSPCGERIKIRRK